MLQMEAGAIWEYVMEPLAQEGVYRGIVADLPMTQAALYSEHTAAVHMTGSVQTYDAILWGTGVRVVYS
ncbi:MAG: hypothetical protein HC767_04320 [Akkermansiaceae bacterium]|nr:hypothetical protein [Akkermansiaceae bacterium]